jgi:hypothetical protein
MKALIILFSFITTTFLLTASALMATPLAANPNYSKYILITCFIQVITFVWLLTLKQDKEL